MKGRDPDLPPPRDLEWGRIARIDVLTSQRTLGRTAGTLLGVLAGVSMAGDGGDAGNTVWLVAMMAGLGGDYLGSRIRGTRELYVASPLPGGPVPMDAPPPAATASEAADSVQSVAASSPREPARTDAEAAPVNQPLTDGVRVEFGVGFSGLAGVGDFGKVTRPCPGGDAALLVVHRASNLGVRVAGGVHLLRGYSELTGEPYYTPYGNQQGRFEAKQSLWWMAIGPVWARKQWGGRLSNYLIVGRGTAKASSSEAWSDTRGEDPGTTTVAIARAGSTWSAPASPVDIGLELVMGGRAAFWNDPPATKDAAGHVLQSRTATITGAVVRLGHTFGR